MKKKRTMLRFPRGSMAKILLRMKLLTILLLSVFAVSANNIYSQQTKFNLKLRGVTVREVFQEIESNSEFIFLYNENKEDVDRKVNIDVQNKSVEAILNQIFEGTTSGYKIYDRQIVIYRDKQKAAAAVEGKAEQSDTKKVSGTVTDQAGEPLPGVTVLVKGTSIGTTTDFDGNYNLEIPKTTTSLQFSFIGMKTQEISLDGKSKIDVEMKEDATGLEQVVVVGFGTQTKESVVGAIEKVDVKEIALPTAQLSNSFTGNIAGVIGVQRSGEPGADGADFWIRGIGTFGANSKPLYILDGVEVTVDEINALAPEVIDGFSVLKDASATALYGARGANGVIIVTTRKGQEGRAKINIRLENSFSMPNSIPDLAGGVTYMKLYNEAQRTRAIDPSSVTYRYSDEKIENTAVGMNPYVYPNVDWYDLIFKDVAINQTANVNISGGSKKIRYFVNASFRHDEGLFENFSNKSIDTGLDNFRYAFQNNLEVDVTPTTKVGLKINAVLEEITRPSTSTAALYSQSMQAPPVEFPAYFPATAEEEGVIDHIKFGNATGGPLGGSNLYHNPFAAFASGQREVNSVSVLAIFNLSQDLKFITEGLKASGVVSFQNYSDHTIGKSYNVNYYKVTDYTVNADNTVDYETGLVNPLTSTNMNYSTNRTSSRLMNMQAQLGYDRTFADDHKVSASLIYLQRNYIAGDQVLATLNQGMSGRVTYNYKSKYFVEYNFGYNGSENFKDGNRFKFFPAYAVGYLVSNEDYWQNSGLANAINHFKVRGSFGYVGNSIAGDRFPYLTTAELNKKNYTFGYDFNNSKGGPAVKKYGTDDATWETSTKLDLGFEMGLFNSLDIVFDYFEEDRKDIFLQRRSIPYSIGVGAARPWANVGRVKNKGFEFSLNYGKQVNHDLYLSARATFTRAKNKFVEKDEPFNTPKNLSQIGKPLSGWQLLESDGLLTADDLNDGIERTNFGSVVEGDIKYIDTNNDQAITDQDGYISNETSVPQIVYGFGASAKYKGWDFSFFFQGSEKVHLLMSNIHPFGQDRKSLLQYIADDYWSEANPNADARYPRLSESVNGNTIVNSDFWLRDASFLRLKNVELGYSFNNMRIYANGVNVATFSKFKLWDPELGSGNGLGYPPVKMFNVGVQLNF
ncbi:SusC/RagA family TonB-linked outer membrane protein [Puteibacter caeruleilacunae]|nr:SusC/RagA family TonB-linked outer membrane protein [Puteibacter caeruleilacunae]